MTAEKDGGEKDLLDASEQTLALAMQASADGAKLLRSKQELLTPKGRAELVVVDSITAAQNCIIRLLEQKQPEGADADEMKAAASHGRTQAQLAMWVIESAMGITPAQQGKSARDIAARVQVQSLGAELSRRLAAKQGRPRIVEAAIPAQVSEARDDRNDAADGGKPAADGG